MSSTRMTAGGRMARLLSLIPWVAANDGPTIDEIATRFDYPKDRLITDLTEAVFMVGVYPYTPDQLIEVVVEDDRVWVRYADYFARALRLTPEQGLALVAAGSTLLAVPGADASGPLARGLAKLAAVIGVEPGESVDVQLGRAPSDLVAQLREAVAQRRRVRIDYYAYGRDDRSRREVEPHRVFADRGEWYLAGWCHQAQGDRVFRIDRIQQLELTEHTFEPPREPPSVSTYDPRPSDPRVVLELAPGARWVVDQYPCEAVDELPGGGLRVVLAVSALPWLERLLLRLGPEATVVETRGELPPDVGPRAARAVLARYARDPNSRGGALGCDGGG